MLPPSDGTAISQNAALVNSLRTLQSDLDRQAPAASGGARPLPSQADLKMVAADTRHARFGASDVQAAQFFLDHPQAFTQAAASDCSTGPTTLPGYRAGKVDAGPDKFSLSLKGPDPDLAVGGTHDQQEAQRDETVKLEGYAASSYETRPLPGSLRWPSDGDVHGILSGLKPNPPIGVDGQDVTHAVYQSEIPNATPDQVFAHWTQQPNEVFNAGGMEIRPPVNTLQSGRYMLETGGTNAPPTWLPVQIKVDPAARTIHIDTLDGHVLRGEQTFSFQDDGCGGTRIVQDARFQASSQLTGDMQHFLPISQGQHDAWQQAHLETYEQFNGNPGYKGIGTPYVDPLSQAEVLGGKAFLQVVAHPARAADAAISGLGDGANYAIDLSGRLGADALDGAGDATRQALDWLHLPGGNAIDSASHETGKFISSLADKTGDVVESGMHKVGDVTKTVIDDLNPFD